MAQTILFNVIRRLEMPPDHQYSCSTVFLAAPLTGSSVDQEKL